MKVKGKFVYEQLDKLFQEAQTIELSNSDKWVIFSDLHMGEGGSSDDFKTNEDLFTSALEKYYLKNDFGLILNGDVEELQRAKFTKIHSYWKSVIELFKKFDKSGKLIKTIGNHDLELAFNHDLDNPLPTSEAVKLRYEENEIFIFHGHQASKKYQQHNQLVGFTLKYFANPLGIKNYSVSHSSRKQYKIEKIAYHYSAYKKIISIIGHTHRPLFESLHKMERLKFKIEELCRVYATKKSDKEGIKDQIKRLKKEAKSYMKLNGETSYNDSVYNSLFHIPCLFNSGTVIGKRGITCLEIENGHISLIHWFDKNISKKYLKHSEYQPMQLEDSDYYKMTINKDHLDYIFTRVNLLS